MTRRGSNLFELQATVLSLRLSPSPAAPSQPVAAAPARPGGPAARAKPPGPAVRVVPRPAPAPAARTAPPPAAAAGAAPVVAQSFDFGAPVLASAPYRGHARRTDGAAAARGFAFGSAVHVEPFSDDDMESLGDDTGDAGAGLDRLDEETPEDEGSGAPEEEPYRLAEESSRAATFSPASAEAMAAVERDLAELARQLTPPAPGGAEAPAAREVEEGSPYGPSVQPAPAPVGGHQVFDAMAQGMAYATEFRLPPVAVKRLFSDFDRELDARDRGRERMRAAAASASGTPAVAFAQVPLPPVPPAPEVPEDVLLRDVASMRPPASGQEPSEAQALVSAGLGLSPYLRHFAPEEVVLTDAQALKVYKFFWPEMDMSTLGPITAADREFAQALVLEALEASHDYSIVEYLMKKTLYKVYPTFDDVKDLVKDVAKEAIRKKWFSKAEKKITADTLDNAVIYEAIRLMIALKFGTPIRERLNGLPPTY